MHVTAGEPRAGSSSAQSGKPVGEEAAATAACYVNCPPAPCPAKQECHPHEQTLARAPVDRPPRPERRQRRARCGRRRRATDDRHRRARRGRAAQRHSASEQAAALGRWFAAMPVEQRPTTVLASPYLRARQTAARIADAGGLQPDACTEIDERLREKEFGILDRLTRAGIERALSRPGRGAHAHRQVLPPPARRRELVRRHPAAAQRARHAEPAPLASRARACSIVAHQVIVLCFRYLIEGMTEEEILAIDARSATSRTAASPSTRSSRRRPAPGTRRAAKLRLVAYNFVAPLEEAGAPGHRAPRRAGRAAMSPRARRARGARTSRAALLRRMPLPALARRRRQGEPRPRARRRREHARAGRDPARRRRRAARRGGQAAARDGARCGGRTRARRARVARRAAAAGRAAARSPARARRWHSGGTSPTADAVLVGPGMARGPRRRARCSAAARRR